MSSMPCASPLCLPPPPMTQQQPLSLLESFLCGGLAGCGAVTISKHAPQPARRPRSPPSQHPRDNEDPSPAPGRAPEKRPLRTQSIPQCPRRIQENMAARRYTRSPTRLGARRKLSIKYPTPHSVLLLMSFYAV